MDIAHYIRHPEDLNKDTLHELRELVAVYPYFHAARLLFLKNLFLLHEPTFDAELRRAALYVPNRKIIFDMVHGKNYQMGIVPAEPAPAPKLPGETDRTQSLIDSFLTQPAGTTNATPHITSDPKSDYMTYLLQTQQWQPLAEAQRQQQNGAAPDRTQTLIENFMQQSEVRIVLQDQAEGPQLEEETTEEEGGKDEAFLTETLARIYIQQGRYERAIEIITKLHARNPKKSIYFADQIRFLQKLVINSKHQ